MENVKKTRVSIAKVADYDSEEIHKALNKCFLSLGGLENLLRPRSKVFVKINHLSPPSPPEKAIVTHPVFTGEVLRLLKILNYGVRQAGVFTVTCII